MAMKVCKDCGTELSSRANACPKCGRDQRNFYSKHKVSTFLLIAMAVIVIAITASGGKNDTIQTNSEVQEKFSLISDKKTTDSIGTTWIEGEIKNNTNKTYSYTQVTFNLYDKEGRQLGTAIDNINNLEPNGTWKYKAMGMITEKVNTYKLVEITGW